MYLIVEHRKDKFRKTWKLEALKKPMSVGHSRHADIRLDKSQSGITGMFEYRQGQWIYSNLKTPKDLNQSRNIAIKGSTIIPLSEGELHVSLLDRQIELFKSHDSTSVSTNKTQLWLLWKRNNKVWFSEYVSTSAKVYWPHNQKPIALTPSNNWQSIEEEGLTLSYKLANTPDSKGLFGGSLKELLDPTLRPFIAAALLGSLLTGHLTLTGTKTPEPVAPVAKKPVVTSSTVVRLEKKPIQEPLPEAPKAPVAKALEAAVAPKVALSAKAKAQRTLGKVFSQIGKQSLKTIAMGEGPKTIQITNTSVPDIVPSNAKTLKVLGSLGSGTGLQPSQFNKGATKEGGVGNGSASIGGKDLGQIAQGNVGQGNIGLLHKESEVSGGLDRDVIAKYINSQKGKILFCYERQLSANPGLFGKVSVKFQITGNGRVEAQNITESTLSNQNVESCLLQLMANWQFPEPKGGVRVLVSYPFVFKSLN
ncbi:MAG: hypothetical protein RJB66_345 [Pseudomonadota bacterium]|jgi:TonB family protein